MGSGTSNLSREIKTIQNRSVISHVKLRDKENMKEVLDKMTPSSTSSSRSTTHLFSPLSKPCGSLQPKKMPPLSEHHPNSVAEKEERKHTASPLGWVSSPRVVSGHKRKILVKVLHIQKRLLELQLTPYEETNNWKRRMFNFAVPS